jgi:mRNA interferase RelE/StbE
VTPTGYSVELSPAAARQLRKLEGTVRKRVLKALASLADDPRPSGVKALVGVPHALRLRVGDYRIVYEVHDGRLVVLVLALGHRREVYRAR